MSIVSAAVPTHGTQDNEEPSAAELAAITAEWPMIAAELDVVDAEIRIVSVVRPSALDWRRLRRAERRVLALRDLAARPAIRSDFPGVA
ncbi:DUF6284 family protein [Cryptosporangium minutisporangium]|uniref:Uncharacterized protein n=1 Tax=Cryptosporangium minutisporangium TaxID=113569 RepID=A0ABP6SXR5_9ACTN